MDLSTIIFSHLTAIQHQCLLLQQQSVHSSSAEPGQAPRAYNVFDAILRLHPRLYFWTVIE